MKRRRYSPLHALRTKQGIAAAKAGANLSLSNDWIHAHAVDPDFDGDDLRGALTMPSNTSTWSVSRDEA